jgi:hypothetical protein
MDISFGNIIKESFGWMGQVLFKTFSLKKWVALTFIAMMAGYLSFNFNGNMNSFTGGNNRGFNTCPRSSFLMQAEGIAEADDAVDAAIYEDDIIIEDADESSELAEFFNPLTISIIGVIFLALMILFMWLNSRFKFIFVEDIIKNDASIKAPWSFNAFIGNQLFLLNLIYTFVYLGLMGLIGYRGFLTLKGLGVFADNADFSFLKVMSNIMPHIIGLIALVIVVSLFYFFVENMVIPIMYKKRDGLLASLKEAADLLTANIGNFIAFLFISIGLGIAAVIATFMIVAMYVLIVAVLAVLVVLLAAAILGLLPVMLKMAVGAVFAVIGIALLIVVYFMANMLLLPIAVFFRTLGLKFVGALDSRYNLFNLSVAEEA